MLKVVSCAMNEAVVWRLGARRFASAPGAVAARVDKTDTSGAPAAAVGVSADVDLPKGSKSTGLVAAAFASLNAPDSAVNTGAVTRKTSPKSVKVNKSQQTDSVIASAADLRTLLSVAESPVVSRRHALKIVSVLSDWSSSNKVKLSDFETDWRFLKLCRILARSRDAAAVSSLARADDLSTVLSVTGDDEAARLVADLTLPQMIKVMSALVVKGRRSTPLLRSLAHHISAQPERLDVKRAADLLYAMAALSFPDPQLMERVCNDIMVSLPKTERVAGVSSVLVSLGLLRYRSAGALDALCEWVTTHPELARPQDVQAALLTLATLAHAAPTLPALVEMALKLREEELPRASAWLELVFSLLLLERVTPAHVDSVLAPAFIEKLFTAGELPIPVRRKLVLLDAYSQLALPPRAGPRLPDEIAQGVPLAYSKEKQLYVQSVLDTLRSLVASDHFMRSLCDSGAAFLFDAEFAVDAKRHPVPLEKAAADKKVFRIAVLALDYHDFCRAGVQPLGINQLYQRILELKGYRVLTVPYTEWNPRDKLVSRVQYLERRIGELVQASA